MPAEPTGAWLLYVDRLRILVTGGAGCIRARARMALARPHAELNLVRLRDAGVSFTHGDAREPEDLRAVWEVDALVEGLAEPSVMADVRVSPGYVVQSNLVGACNCLEPARTRGAQFGFLSTSRIYPVAPLKARSYAATDERSSWPPHSRSRNLAGGDL